MKKTQKGSSKASKKVDEPKPVPVPVAAFAEVLADGTLGKPNKTVKVKYVSTGIYHVEFDLKEAIRSVLVQVRRKPHSLRVLARLSSLNAVETFLQGNLRSLEVALVSSAMRPVDRPFSILAITDGSRAVFKSIGRSVSDG